MDTRGVGSGASEIDRSLTRAEKRALKFEQTLVKLNKQLDLLEKTGNNAQFKTFNDLNNQQMKQLQDFSKYRKRVAEIDARSEAKLAQEAAKRVTQAKQSELRIFENTERSKLRAVEQSARARAQADNNAFRASEAAKRREFQEYQRLEREKTRIAQAEARKRQSFDVGGGLQNAGQGLRSAGTASTVAITAPLVLAGKAILTAGIEYERALNTFEAVTKATGEEMARAADEAKKLGADITLPATSAKDAALAMTELGKASFSANEAIAASKGVLQLAAAGQLEEAEAAKITANALQAFSLSADQATRVADLLAAAANSSSADVSDIAQAMKQASAQAEAAKVPIEDLTAAIAIMANNAIQGSDAGTALKTFMIRLQAPTDTAAESLKALGISVYDLKGRMKPLPQLIGDFEKAFAGMTDEKKAQAIKNIFGDDASRAAQILFKTGEEGFNKMKEAVTVTGAAADLAAAKTKGLGGAWDAFVSQLETIGIDIFNAVGPSLTNILQQVGAFTEIIGNAFSQLSPSVQVAIIAFAAFAAAIGPVLIVVGAIVGALGTTISAISTAVAAIGGASAILPVLGAVIAGVAVSIAALTVIFGPVIVAIAAFKTAYENDFYKVREITDKIIVGIQTAWSSFMTALQTLTSDALQQITKFWNENGEGIMQAATTVMNAIYRTISDFLEAIQNFWKTNGNEITAIVNAAWEAIKAVVTAGINVVLNVIKLVAAIINGDWSSAWQAALQIVLTIISGIDQALWGILVIVANVLKGVGDYIATAHYTLTAAAFELGKNIVLGISRGMASINLVSIGVSIVSNLLDSMNSEAQTQSPSKKTTQLGIWIAEGLMIGMNNSVSRVKNSAKNLASEIIKELKDAIAEFQKLAGATPEQVRGIQTKDRISAAISGQGEIIKLRGKLGVNQSLPLPSTVGETERELASLQQQQKAVEDLDKSYEEWHKTLADIEDLQEKQAVDFEKKLEGMRQSGALELLNLEEEINLTGVLDERERQRIQNSYELLRVREQMKNDGFAQSQIDEAVEVLRVEQMRSLELQRILEIRKQVADATGLEKNLLNELSGLQNGNQELSKYQETLNKINTELKDISPQQKENLLTLAKQIDAVEELNKQHAELKGFFSESLEYIFDGDIKGLLTSFTDRIKDSFIDNLSDIFATNILGFNPKDSDNPVAQKLDTTNQLLTTIATGLGANPATATTGGGGASGNFLVKIFRGMFGGSGGASTPPFNPNAGGGGNILSQILGGGFPTLGHEGSMAGGALLSTLGHEGNHAGAGGGGFLSKILGKGGIFGEQGFGNNVGTYGAVGAGAGLLGNLIGGRVGGFLSGAGSGLAMGAQIGSMIFPGIGTAVGAGIGALVGGIASLFGSNKARRSDERTRNQAMLDAFSAMDKLILDVKSDRIDGEQALSQADQIRSSYVEQMSQLKDKKTRRIALADVRRIDEKIAALKTAASAQTQRKERLTMLTPTFADGGAVSKFISSNYRHNPLGYVQGPGTSRSDSIDAYFPIAQTFAKISNREYVLDAETTQNIGIRNLDRLRAGKGRDFGGIIKSVSRIHQPRIHFADGGAVGLSSGDNQTANTGNTAAAGGMKLYITNIFEKDENGNISNVKTEAYLNTPSGEAEIEEIVEKKIYQNRSTGPIPTALKRVNNGQG